jgi:hypothetical protein
MVRAELQLHHLPDKSLHIARYTREDLGFLEIYETVMVEPMFCHCQFVWIAKLYVSVVHLTTLAGYTVNPWGPQSQVILHKDKGDWRSS